ncbi:MAG: FG-GAP-like repeat-containing protein [Acidobacteriota bacterium]
MKNVQRFVFVLAAALLGVRASDAQVFTNEVRYGSLNQPVAVRLADVNGDGLLDMLALGQSPGTVIVIESVNDGTYLPETSVPTGATNPTALAVADFDGNGSADLAVANNGPNDIVLLFGDGKGAFSSPIAAFTVSQTVNDLETGDVDADGDEDLVVTYGSSLRAALNDGNGTLTLKTSGPSPGNAIGLSLGSFSGTYLDAVVCHGSQVGIYVWSSAIGNFSNSAINLSGLASGTPTDTATADMNNDGELDVVVGLAASPSKVQVFLKNGSAYNAQTEASLGASGLQAIGLGDGDKNGFIDVMAVLGAGTDELVFLGSTGGSFFPPEVYSTGTGADAIAVGDADADTDEDVLVANFGSDDLSYFRGFPIASVFWSANVHCGTSPLNVSFTDRTVPTPNVWLWTFGDGASSAQQNPNHVYTSGTFRQYDVTLKVMNTTSRTYAKYITIFETTPSEIIMGLGPGPTTDHPPASAYIARDCEEGGYTSAVNGALHYGTFTAGVNVDGANLDGTFPGQFVTGPGNVAVFGPHVRGWLADGVTPISPAVSFFAYGTLKFGVKVRGAQLDGDGFDEIVTGAGQGIVFGPHVRGWNYDGVAISAISKISYFAYPTYKYGVNVAAADLDQDPGGDDEILTGPVYSAAYATTVRGWNASAAGVSQLFSFDAFGSPNGFGATVGAGDIDGDGFAEILAGRGPGSSLTADVAGFNYDGSGTPSAISNVAFSAWTNYFFGAIVASGDVDGDGFDEIVVAPGPDPAARPLAKGYDVDGTGAPVVISGLSGANPFAVAYPLARYGATLGIADLGKLVP